jgi:hypothetical protein
MVRRSTGVAPVGTQMTIWGEISAGRGSTLRMNCLIISSATSKSAMTPSRSGRMTSMLRWVLPSMVLASAPTA